MDFAITRIKVVSDLEISKAVSFQFQCTYQKLHFQFGVVLLSVLAPSYQPLRANTKTFTDLWKFDVLQTGVRVKEGLQLQSVFL